MLNNKKILLPKYFYYNRIYKNTYIVGNALNSNYEIISKQTLLILLSAAKVGNISFDKIVNKDITNNIMNLYNEDIILENINNSSYKFSEEFLIMGDKFLHDAEKLSILKNADKVIYLHNKDFLSVYNNNSIFIGENSDYALGEWEKKIEQTIIKEITPKKNLLLVEFQGNSAFGGQLNNSFKRMSNKYSFSYKYISSVSYLDKIYENTFMNYDPMTTGFLSIDLQLLLKKNFLDIDYQIIITRVGYLSGIENVYGKNWKSNLKTELLLLKNKLLEFYKKDNNIYILNSKKNKKLKIKNIVDSINYWIPGNTSILIDGH